MAATFIVQKLILKAPVCIKSSLFRALAFSRGFSKRLGQAILSSKGAIKTAQIEAQITIYARVQKKSDSVCRDRQKAVNMRNFAETAAHIASPVVKQAVQNAKNGVALATLCGVGLTGCSDLPTQGLFQNRSNAEETVTRATSTITTGERDVEAPEIFEAGEAGLWDGRPSLGGVWVAHPDVQDPERALIRNTASGETVVGALFRRERASSGPKIQISSDAADALGILAGAPTDVYVVALRKEEIVQPDPAVANIETTALLTDDVQTTSLDVVSTAPDIAPQTIAAANIDTIAQIQPAASSLSKPYVQIGIFSVEENARNTATAMTQSGLHSELKKQSYNGKIFWRVLVGPAQSSSDLAQMIETAKGKGFTDAYAVKG